jgi:hypothetical protein
LKKNVEVIKDPLDKIKSIRGVEFEWKENLGSKDIGFIAQEILPHIPEVVHFSEKFNHYTVKYKEIIAVSIEALKEQEIKINSLEFRYNKLVERAKEKGLL